MRQPPGTAVPRCLPQAAEAGMDWMLAGLICHALHMRRILAGCPVAAGLAEAAAAVLAVRSAWELDLFAKSRRRPAGMNCWPMARGQSKAWF